MCLSLLARRDYWITLLTSSPDPYGLAEELSRGHPFDIDVLATFPTAPWATGLKEEITDLHIGCGWYKIDAQRMMALIGAFWQNENTSWCEYDKAAEQHATETEQLVTESDTEQEAT